MAIDLRKGQTLNLQPSSAAGLGDILVNLSWNSRGFRGPIDLDLACMYELNNGMKGVVQALGNAFGSKFTPPYIMLDGDDRSGLGGENLYINGNMVSQIKRILVFTFIYDGVANWQQANAVVTIRYPGAQDIIVRLDEYYSSQTVCALAMFRNINNVTFNVEKLVQFYPSHQVLDQAFGWDLPWVLGRKD